MDLHGNVNPPETAILGGHPGPRAERAYFSWTGESSGDEVVGGDCRLDGGAWFACTSPLQFDVPYGEHRFEVRSVDVDGVPRRDAGRACLAGGPDHP